MNSFPCAWPVLLGVVHMSIYRNGEWRANWMTAFKTMRLPTLYKFIHASVERFDN